MPTQVEYEQQLNAMLRDIAGATNAFYAYLEIYRFNKKIENKQRLDQYPYQARAGCATSAGSRRTRLAPPGMLPVLS